MKRLLTALLGVPAVVFLTLFAPRWLFGVALACVSALCLEELFALGGAKLGSRPGRWAVLLGAAVTLSFLGTPASVIGSTSLAMLIAACVTTFSVPLEEAFPKTALAGLGIAYCGVLLGFLLWMSRPLVIVLLGIVWIGDAAAFYGGRMFGRHLLAPSISPKKTVEGALAGLIGSVVGGVLLGVWLAGVKETGTLVLASLVSGAVGQVGDLAESALKRSTGVKDSSSLLPGHGGMLDRLDSLLFAAPIYYWFFRP